MEGVTIEAPKALELSAEGQTRRRRRGGWGGPRKILHFFASKSHVCDALWHPFEVILLLVENQHQCIKWFILQCYNQILLTDPGQDAFYHDSNRTTRPKWLVLRKLCGAQDAYSHARTTCFLLVWHCVVEHSSCRHQRSWLDTLCFQAAAEDILVWHLILSWLVAVRAFVTI